MPKYVRHKPGYTPEAAAARRVVRQAARKFGISPRRLKKMYRRAAYSAARHALKSLQTIFQINHGTLVGKFHSGGFVSAPPADSVPAILSSGCCHAHMVGRALEVSRRPGGAIVTVQIGDRCRCPRLYEDPLNDPTNRDTSNCPECRKPW